VTVGVKSGHFGDWLAVRPKEGERLGIVVVSDGGGYKAVGYARLPHQFYLKDLKKLMPTSYYHSMKILLFDPDDLIEITGTVEDCGRRGSDL